VRLEANGVNPGVGTAPGRQLFQMFADIRPIEIQRFGAAFLRKIQA